MAISRPEWRVLSTFCVVARTHTGTLLDITLRLLPDMHEGTHKPHTAARRDRMSVMWNRIYGKEKFANLYDRYFACQQLKMTLELTGCKRLVIGHTPQVCSCPSDAPEVLRSVATVVCLLGHGYVVACNLDICSS